jgi:hypothetical protein
MVSETCEAVKKNRYTTRLFAKVWGIIRNPILAISHYNSDN